MEPNLKKTQQGALPAGQGSGSSSEGQTPKSPGGVAKPGVLGNSRAKLTIDQSIATGRELTEKKPDLNVMLVDRKEIWIFVVACAWEPQVVEREREREGSEVPGTRSGPF